jgi:hypothetical protein
MAYIKISYHRDSKRIGSHVRYIAERPESRGLRGIGPEFRALGGDVDAATRLLRQHGQMVRARAGANLREGPFWRFIFTLPTPLAQRVAASDHVMQAGSTRVMQDAIEATFRSAGRDLQGVYAIHFHAASRREHAHVHVDLSPLDRQGRRAHITERQRDNFKDAWVREVERALARIERRQRYPELDETETLTSRMGLRATASKASSERVPGSTGMTRARHRRTGERTYLPALVSHLFGLSRSPTPLLDLVLRALVARASVRMSAPIPSLAVRVGLGLNVRLGRTRVAALEWGDRER